MGAGRDLKTVQGSTAMQRVPGCPQAGCGLSFARQCVGKPDLPPSGKAGEGDRSASLWTASATCHQHQAAPETDTAQHDRLPGPLPCSLRTTASHEVGQAVLQPPLELALLRLGGQGHLMPSWSQFQLPHQTLQQVLLSMGDCLCPATSIACLRERSQATIRSMGCDSTSTGELACDCSLKHWVQL